MSPEDRASILAQIGVTEPDAASVEAPAPEPEPVTEPVKVKRKKNKEVVVTQDGDGTESASDVLARILKNAGASKDTALAMCDAEAQAFFDQRSVTKIEAARRGLADRSVHNKPLWQEAQALRETLKTGVRKHFQDRTIATKIKATSVKAENKRDEMSDDELESFMASEAFRALLAEHKKSLKSQEG